MCDVRMSTTTTDWLAMRVLTVSELVRGTVFYMRRAAAQVECGCELCDNAFYEYSCVSVYVFNLWLSLD